MQRRMMWRSSSLFRRYVRGRAPRLLPLGPMCPRLQCLHSLARIGRHSSSVSRTRPRGAQASRPEPSWAASLSSIRRPHFRVACPRGKTYATSCRRHHASATHTRHGKPTHCTRTAFCQPRRYHIRTSMFSLQFPGRAHVVENASGGGRPRAPRARAPRRLQSP
jgi:hypothetical protein